MNLSSRTQPCDRSTKLCLLRPPTVSHLQEFFTFSGLELRTNISLSAIGSTFYVIGSAVRLVWQCVAHTKLWRQAMHAVLLYSRARFQNANPQCCSHGFTGLLSSGGGLEPSGGRVGLHTGLCVHWLLTGKRWLLRLPRSEQRKSPSATQRAVSCTHSTSCTDERLLTCLKQRLLLTWELTMGHWGQDVASCSP
jgi:hypothetical protein